MHMRSLLAKCKHKPKSIPTLTWAYFIFTCPASHAAMLVFLLRFKEVYLWPFSPSDLPQSCSGLVHVCAVNDTWTHTRTRTPARTNAKTIRSLVLFALYHRTTTNILSLSILLYARENTQLRAFADEDEDDDCVMLLKSRTYWRLLVNGPTERLP